MEQHEAQQILESLAQVALHSGGARSDLEPPNLEAQYRTLIEQIPAVVFMVYLDGGIGQAYVSPQIEEILGFTRAEWLEDPIRWYERIHPDDKSRWSSEAAHMFLSGTPLRSVYRVIARDGRVVSFRCDAKMVRRSNGQPWFIHGVGFDITDLKRAEDALNEERNFASAVVDTVGALVLVLDPQARIVRFNRACEQTSGYDFSQVVGGEVCDLLVAPEDRAHFRETFEQLRAGQLAATYESAWESRDGSHHVISWSGTSLSDPSGALEYVVLTGIDITEAKRLERTILEISGREQRRIGQDLHDGLGQHLTGVAFLSKVLEQKLREKSLPEVTDAAKIVGLVNEAIDKTRELSHGLLPVLSDAGGLMTALESLALQVEDLFQVTCTFECADAVPIRESEVATHLYHIAQEAVNNGLRHGKPTRISIQLAGGPEPFLQVADDGVGLQQGRERGQGMGLLIMSYRAKMVGGSLTVSPGAAGGTVVFCAFPASNLALPSCDREEADQSQEGN
jgi:PAS domain S-box-containing protein